MNVRSDGGATSTACHGSPAPIRGAKCATLTRDGTIDDGSVSEQIEETGLGSDGNPSQAAVPVPEQEPQLIAKLGEIAETRF
jgi:hypothetical protein